MVHGPCTWWLNMVHGLGTWTMHERGLRLDSWACTVVVNLGSVKWYPNNVVDQRPRTFIGRWPRVNHHHEGCGTKTQALGTGFQAQASHHEGFDITAHQALHSQGSRAVHLKPHPLKGWGIGCRVQVNEVWQGLDTPLIQVKLTC